MNPTTIVFGELIDGVVVAISNVGDIPDVVDLLYIEPISNTYQRIRGQEDMKKMFREYHGFKEIHLAIGLDLFQSQVTQDYMNDDGV